MDVARMPFDLPLRCRCGRVRGIASEFAPSGGFRLVCYCRDCQAFARFLDRADVLDAAGGTDIVQMPPGRVKLTAGIDAVRSLQFSNKVFRWYADCCGSPIANTASSARVPFFGLVHSFISVEAEGPSRNEILDENSWPAAVSHLRALRHRAAAAECASAGLARPFCSSRSEGARLVVARARPAEPILRRSYRRSALRAASCDVERARGSLNGLTDVLVECPRFRSCRSLNPLSTSHGS